jgi:hypothetical protein
MFFNLNAETALFLHATVIRISTGNRNKELQIVVWCNMFCNLKLYNTEPNYIVQSISDQTINDFQSMLHKKH